MHSEIVFQFSITTHSQPRRRPKFSPLFLSSPSDFARIFENDFFFTDDDDESARFILLDVKQQSLKEDSKHDDNDDDDAVSALFKPKVLNEIIEKDDEEKNFGQLFIFKPKLDPPENENIEAFLSRIEEPEEVDANEEMEYPEAIVVSTTTKLTSAITQPIEEADLDLGESSRVFSSSNTLNTSKLKADNGYVGRKIYCIVVN